MHTPDIVTLLARKGGVGKSMLATLLALVYAENGVRVTLVDLDPQGTATSVVAPYLQVDALAFSEHLSAGERLTGFVQDTSHPGLRVVPINEGLTVCETHLASHPMGVAKVRNALTSLRSADCDLVIVDTPPTLGAFTFGALAAATWAVIPTLCEEPSIRTLPSAFRTIREAQTLNADLRVLAVVANRLDRTTRHGLSALQTLRQAFPDHLARTAIPRAIAIPDAMRPGCPLDPDAPALQAVVQLAAELFDRMARHPSQTVGCNAVIEGNELNACERR